MITTTDPRRATHRGHGAVLDREPARVDATASARRVRRHRAADTDREPTDRVGAAYRVVLACHGGAEHEGP